MCMGSLLPIRIDTAADLLDMSDACADRSVFSQCIHTDMTFCITGRQNPILCRRDADVAKPVFDRRSDAARHKAAGTDPIRPDRRPVSIHRTGQRLFRIAGQLGDFRKCIFLPQARKSIFFRAEHPAFNSAGSVIHADKQSVRFHEICSFPYEAAAPMRCTGRNRSEKHAMNTKTCPAGCGPFSRRESDPARLSPDTALSQSRTCGICTRICNKAGTPQGAARSPCKLLSWGVSLQKIRRVNRLLLRGPGVRTGAQTGFSRRPAKQNSCRAIAVSPCVRFF